MENQDKFQTASESSVLKVNDYCYVDFNEKLFDKSFDVKVNFAHSEIYNYIDYIHSISFIKYFEILLSSPIRDKSLKKCITS